MRTLNGSEIIMGEKPVKVPGPDGKMTDGFEVPVDETTERWSEVTLEDGSIIRVKTTVMSAIRVANQWDQEGHPVYLVKSVPAVMIASSPAGLKRKVS